MRGLVRNPLAFLVEGGGALPLWSAVTSSIGWSAGSSLMGVARTSVNTSMGMVIRFASGRALRMEVVEVVTFLVLVVVCSVVGSRMVAVVLYTLVVLRCSANLTLFFVTPAALAVVGLEVLGFEKVVFAMMWLLSWLDMY